MVPLSLRAPLDPYRKVRPRVKNCPCAVEESPCPSPHLQGGRWQGRGLPREGPWQRERVAFLGPLRQRCDNHCSLGPLDICPNGQARAMERWGLTSSAPKASPEWALALSSL